MDFRRAPRFPVRFFVRYRPVGAKRWQAGRVENISRSGVFFWTKQAPAVDTPLQMSFDLPLAASKSGVVCRGRVVRTVVPTTAEAPWGLAATISRYQFVRGKSTAAEPRVSPDAFPGK
jgi:hypothetical protein